MNGYQVYDQELLNIIKRYKKIFISDLKDEFIKPNNPIVLTENELLFDKKLQQLEDLKFISYNRQTGYITYTTQ